MEIISVQRDPAVRGERGKGQVWAEGSRPVARATSLNFTVLVVSLAVGPFPGEAGRAAAGLQASALSPLLALFAIVEHHP